MTQLSLVVPAFNEVELIEKSAAVFTDFLEQRGLSWELIFSDDGSSDGTVDLLNNIAKSDKKGRIKVIASPVNQGKGGALTLGLDATTGETVAYIDADLEIPIEHLGEVLDGIDEGFDCCVGSKYIGDSKRESKRKMAHLVYNGMVRHLLGSRVHDHSCGVKAFRREVVDAVLSKMQDKKWVWDTEFLVRAQMNGFRVKEIAIHSVSRRQSKVKFFSAVMDSFGAVLGLYGRGVKVPRKLRPLATTPARQARVSSQG